MEMVWINHPIIETQGIIMMMMMMMAEFSHSDAITGVAALNRAYALNRVISPR